MEATLLDMSGEEFRAFSQAMDQCWMESRFNDLKKFLAEDVVLVAPGGSPRLEGIMPVIESYRQFMTYAQVRLFRSRDHVVTTRRETAIGEYAWEMTWVAEGIEHLDEGREILVLVRGKNQWRVAWRTQIPALKA